MVMEYKPCPPLRIALNIYLGKLPPLRSQLLTRPAPRSVEVDDPYHAHLLLTDEFVKAEQIQGHDWGFERVLYKLAHIRGPVVAVVLYRYRRVVQDRGWV